MTHSHDDAARLADEALADVDPKRRGPMTKYEGRMRTREPALARAVKELIEERRAMLSAACGLRIENPQTGHFEPLSAWLSRFDALAARGGESDNRGEATA